MKGGAQTPSFKGNVCAASAGTGVTFAVCVTISVCGLLHTPARSNQTMNGYMTDGETDM